MDAQKSTPADVEALFALEDLEIEEVSLVDRGDNPAAQIVMVKSKPDDVAPTSKGMMRERKQADEMRRDKNTFAELVADLMLADYDEPERIERMSSLVGEYAEILRGYGPKGERMAKALYAALDDTEGDASAIGTEIKKIVGAVGAPAEPAGDEAPAQEAQMAEKVKAETEAPAEAEVTEKEAPAAAAPAQPVDEVAKERDDLAKALAASDQRAAELAKRLEAVEARDALRTEIAKVEADYPAVGGASTEDLAKALMAVRAKAPEAVDVLASVLKAANEAGKDAFLGKSAEGEPDRGSKLDAYRAEVQKVKTEQGLSHERAMLAVRKSRPDLHAAAFGGE